jgi:hypothetical protein
LNVALTVVLAVRTNEHVFEVEQPETPDQPANTEPALAAAVRFTVIPELPVDVHVAPQLIAPVDVTVPEPVPDLVIDTVYVLD